jgi:hypothetical protein
VLQRCFCLTNVTGTAQIGNSNALREGAFHASSFGVLLPNTFFLLTLAGRS